MKIIRRLKSTVSGLLSDRETYRLTRWLFLRGLAVVYLIAFLSFWIQFEGLVGSNGILPFPEYLSSISQQLDGDGYLRFPTLAWLIPSDWFIHAICLAGTLFSAALFFNVVPAFSALFLWMGYLSVTVVGQTFMGYQWDNLLLEAGFLAVFFAPWKIHPGQARREKVPIVTLWLLRILLFKLIFASGLVKLASGDAGWQNLSALTYHFFTQPLPTVPGWLVHQLPDFLLKITTGLALGIEILSPLLIFTTRRGRQYAGYIIGGFMGIVFLTGNYGFFNILTIVLCITLFDDRFFRSIFPDYLSTFGNEKKLLKHVSLKKWLLYGYVAVYLAMSGSQIINIGAGRSWIPESVRSVINKAEAFRSINNYGLFADMTTKRPEIVIQGSRNKKNWKSYRFYYKPGELSRRPVWAQPHMPRLDWQMWFQALRYPRVTPWFKLFIVKILKGEKQVLELLRHNPFPEHPPRFVRAVIYRYEFTDIETLLKTGQWWKRGKPKRFIRPVSLKDIRGQ